MMYKFISSIMRSYEPRHEDKENAVAYLYSCWLKGWEVKDDSKE